MALRYFEFDTTAQEDHWPLRWYFRIGRPGHVGYPGHTNYPGHFGYPGPLVVPDTLVTLVTPHGHRILTRNPKKLLLLYLYTSQ